MDRKTLIHYKQPIQSYLSAIRFLTLGLLISAGLGYLLSLMLLLQGNHMMAAIFATGIFIASYVLKNYLPHLARFGLKRKAGYEELFKFLDKEQKSRTTNELVAFLQKAIEAI